MPTVTARHLAMPTRVPVALVIREPGLVQLVADPRLSEVALVAAAMQLLTEDEIAVLRCACVATECSHAGRLSLFGDGYLGSYPLTLRTDTLVAEPA
jgi:hypothetical protein